MLSLASMWPQAPAGSAEGGRGRGGGAELLGRWPLLEQRKEGGWEPTGVTLPIFVVFGGWRGLAVTRCLLP